MTDRIPATMTDTCIRLFGREEAFDSEGFISFFTDSPVYQFGNGLPCLTKDAIKGLTDGLLGTVVALYHDIRSLSEVNNMVFVEMDVTYWRKDGTSITLPRADILRFKDDMIEELRIYMDASPLGNPAIVADKLSSVMTQSEGKRATAPGYMRKYFYEHPEGIARVKQGLGPKWAIAGPMWPIIPREAILMLFQGALRSGDFAGAASHLTNTVVLRISNQAEVTGVGAVMGALGNLVTTVLRPLDADVTGIWEPDGVLIIRMNVTAMRLTDGKEVKYECVETYRFDGDKICEWRIYPLEPALLAVDSLVGAIA